MEMLKYDSDVLKHLQEVELMILKDVINVLDKNNLPYYMYGGSALGSVRHDGFIPWDDDIDIAMFREDYEKAIKILSEQLDDKYFVCCFETEPEFFLGFMKVYLKGTFFTSYFTEDLKDYVNFESNIFIDIFPLDKAPNYIFIAKIFYLINNLFLNILFNYHHNIIRDSKLINFKLLIIHYIAIIFPISFWQKLIYKINTYFNNNNSNKCIDWNSYVFNVYTYSDFVNYIWGKFEGLNVKLPNNYDRILTQIYGDYMKLPPEEERYNHASKKIDFGKY